MTKKAISPKSEIEQEQKARLPQLQRARPDELPGLQLTLRDIGIIMAICDYRALTTAQIEEIFFTPTTRSQCSLRLKLLFQHGYLQRTEQQLAGKHPLIHWLDKRGQEVVAAQRKIDPSEVDWTPKPQALRDLFLDHLIATNTVRLSIARAAAKHGFLLEEWRDDKTLKRDHAHDKVTIVGAQGGTQLVAVVPDGYGVIVNPHPSPKHVYRFFLETDRSTMTVSSEHDVARTWGKKIAAYNAYFASDIYKTRYATEAGKGRVVTVTLGEKRLEHLKRITEAQSGKMRYWFTTFERIAAGDILTDKVFSVASLPELREMVR
jgi:hypothetical protein